MADSPHNVENREESPWWLPVRGRFDYLAGAGMALTGIFVVAAVALSAMAVSNAATEPTGPARAQAERESYERDQTIRLASYRWVDERARLVTVPIEVAKDVVVRRGVAPLEIEQEGGGDE